MAQVLVNLEGDASQIEKIESELVAKYGKQLTVEFDWQPDTHC